MNEWMNVWQGRGIEKLPELRTKKKHSPRARLNLTRLLDQKTQKKNAKNFRVSTIRTHQQKERGKPRTLGAWDAGGSGSICVINIFISIICCCSVSFCKYSNQTPSPVSTHTHTHIYMEFLSYTGEVGCRGVGGRWRLYKMFVNRGSVWDWGGATMMCVIEQGFRERERESGNTFSLLTVIFSYLSSISDIPSWNIE